MKKIISFCISLILILASFTVCFAAVFEIDSFTGEIVKDGTDASTNYVSLSSSCTYDRTSDTYIYALSNKNETTVTVTACDGMVVEDWASIEPSESAQIVVYHNGEVVPETDYSDIVEPGTYTIRTVGVDREVMSFTVVGEKTGLLYSYQIPKNFSLLSCYKDGQEIQAPGGFIDLTEEGTYVIKYRCAAADVTEELTLNIDHTAPELIINGVKNGLAKQPVTIEETEDNAVLVMKRDGEPIAISDVLKTAGDYEITYTDEAGNTSTYEFTMRVFLDGGAWVFVVIAVILIGLAAGFMIYSRKHMRTR